MKTILSLIALTALAFTVILVAAEFVMLVTTL